MKSVYDFEGGKAYWLACGRRTIRSSAQPARVIDEMERDVPACRIDASVADAMQALDDHPEWEQCLVVNEADIVLGVLPRGTPTTRALSDVVKFGPTTVRPDAELDETRDRMRERRIAERVVTDPDGRLLGVLRLPSG